MPLTAAVPRQTVYLLVLVDIPPRLTSLPEGAESDARLLRNRRRLSSEFTGSTASRWTDWPNTAEGELEVRELAVAQFVEDLPRFGVADDRA
jgi:hypothetical protein